MLKTQKDKAEIKKSIKGIVHVLNEGGHRREYRDILANKLCLKPDTGRITFSKVLTMLKAQKLLFATVPRGGIYILWIGALRAILGRKTCAITISDNWWQHPRRRALNFISLIVFRLLDKFNRLSVMSILPPFSRSKKVSFVTDWIHDPQLWDFADTDYLLSGRLPISELSRAVQVCASGRPVVVFIGKASLRKGIDEFSELSACLAEKFLFVVAGRVDCTCHTFAKKLTQNGMLVVDRYIEDSELLSLYGVADYCWCRYAPSNQVNSGVFGRAFQFGVPAIVREGAFLDRLAAFLRHDVIYDLCKVSTYSTLSSENPRFSNLASSAETRKQLVGYLCEESIERLSSRI